MPLHRPEAGERADVLRPLELTWILAMELAHTAEQLADGSVFVRGQPLAQLAFDDAQVINSVTIERRTQHRDTGPGHQHFQHILSRMNAAGCGEAGPDAPGQNHNQTARAALARPPCRACSNKPRVPKVFPELSEPFVFSASN